MPRTLVQTMQHNLMADAILRFFSERELMAVRLVSKYFRRAAERYIWTSLTYFRAYNTRRRI